MILKMDDINKSTNSAFAARGKANAVIPRKKKALPVSMVDILKNTQLHEKNCYGDEEVDLMQQFSIKRHLISIVKASFRSNTHFIV